MPAPAAIIAFPVNAPRQARFTSQERNAIIGAALALRPAWGASFALDDAGAEVAAIGPQSGGDGDTWDAFGLAFVGRGRVELLDFADYETVRSYCTVAHALDAMRQAVGMR